MKDNIEDKELEEARQFTYGYNLEYHDINGVDCPKIDSIADLALAYHRHRLETAWVSVKERLPEKDVLVLVIAPDSNIVGDRLIGARKDDYWKIYGFDYGHDTFNVTHWQPLPSPPKETKE